LLNRFVFVFHSFLHTRDTDVYKRDTDGTVLMVYE